MRLTLTFIAIALLAVVPAIAEESGPEQLQMAFVKAVEEENLEALAACYTADATSYPIDGMRVTGRQAVRDSWAPLFTGFDVTSLEVSEGHHHVVGDAAVAWGLFKMTFVPRTGGDPIIMQGRFTDMSKKIGDEWLYVFDHVSVPMAPPPE